MTISLQQYRLKIANFNSIHNPRKPIYSKVYPKTNIFIIFLLLSTTLYYGGYDDYECKGCHKYFDDIHNINIHYSLDNNNSSPFLFNHRTAHNKLMKIYNGNISSIKSLKIMQYNKGSSDYSKKEHILNKHITDKHIDIACISEANISESYLANNDVLSGYICESKPMSDRIDMSRNIILINENIPYIRRRDLENEYIATIWIEVKLKSKKNILVMGGYRQWRLFKELGIIDSNKTKNQIDRFKKIIEQWSNAIKEGKDVIVVMDTNIDTQTNSNHNTTNRIKPLYDILQQH